MHHARTSKKKRLGTSLSPQSYLVSGNLETTKLARHGGGGDEKRTRSPSTQEGGWGGGLPETQAKGRYPYCLNCRVMFSWSEEQVIPP